MLSLPYTVCMSTGIQYLNIASLQLPIYHRVQYVSFFAELTGWKAAGMNLAKNTSIMQIFSEDQAVS